MVLNSLNHKGLKNVSVREELTGRANQWLPVIQMLGTGGMAKEPKQRSN